MSLRSNQRSLISLSVGGLLLLTGCSALSPRQLWKLNRQPRMDQGDAYFSVPAGDRTAAASRPRTLPADETPAEGAE